MIELRGWKTILGTLDDKLFPGGIIPRFQSRVMLYYAVDALYQGMAPIGAIVESLRWFDNNEFHRPDSYIRRKRPS